MNDGIKSLAKRSLRAIPQPLRFRLFYRLNDRWSRDWFKERRKRDMEVFHRLGLPDVIPQGPFKGMRYRPYYPQTEGSPMLPKIAGTYEIEVHPAIEAICRMPVDRIINIGAGEGYYGVGVAMRLPGARVLCYELSKATHEHITFLAWDNGVAGRVEVRGLCKLTDLRGSLSGSDQPVVICDVEGAEHDLLRPDELPRLREATVLVEIHEGLRPGVYERIAERFRPTHSIEVYQTRARTPADLPSGWHYSGEDAAKILDENRALNPMHWFFMVPRAHRDRGGVGASPLSS
jgi:hypothetical protein